MKSEHSFWNRLDSTEGNIDDCPLGISIIGFVLYLLLGTNHYHLILNYYYKLLKNNMGERLSIRPMQYFSKYTFLHRNLRF